MAPSEFGPVAGWSSHHGARDAMSIAWRDLGAAFALYLVLEGLLPFLSPRAASRVFAQMARSPARQLRIVGLLSMLGGCVLLYFVRG